MSHPIVPRAWRRVLRADPFRASVSALALVALLAPASAWAASFNSHGGFLFDVMDQSTGALSNGTSDAYDHCYAITVFWLRRRDRPTGGALQVHGRRLAAQHVSGAAGGQQREQEQGGEFGPAKEQVP